MNIRGFILFVSLFVIITAGCFAQADGETPTPVPDGASTPAPTAAPGATAGAEIKSTPMPYEEDEFPQWIKDIRRAEVVLIGSIPFTMFVSIEIFDTYRFVSADFDSAYAPWPMKGPQSAAYTEGDKITIIITALSLSATIALVDHIIIRANRSKKTIPKSNK